MTARIALAGVAMMVAGVVSGYTLPFRADLALLVGAWLAFLVLVIPVCEAAEREDRRRRRLDRGVLRRS